MIAKTPLIKTGLAVACAFALAAPAHADDAPKISTVLQKMLGNLPIKADKQKLLSMVSALKKTSCGGGLTGCYMTNAGTVQLYFFTSGTAQQTFLVVDDETMAMPALLGGKVQKVMGKTTMGSPIISISTTSYTLPMASMPAALQNVVNAHYYGVGSLTFEAGVQVEAALTLGGPIKDTMAKFGVKTDGLVMRAAAVLPIPTDLTSAAGSGAGLAEAMKQGETMKSAGAKAMEPEAYVEFQFAPNTLIKVPEPAVNLTDATFFLNNELVFGYKGNAMFAGDDKNMLIQFQTPLQPEGVADFADFQFLLATSVYNLSDGMTMMADMSTPDPRLLQYGGGFIRNISGTKGSLSAATGTVSVFQLRNPNPPPVYKFGDPTHPWPTDLKYFNVAVLGPLASGGPILTLNASLTLLGQPIGAFFGSVGTNGLSAQAIEDVNLKLGPLGNVTVPKMVATANVGPRVQDLSLKGKFIDQPVSIVMSGNNVAIDVPATCTNPFMIHTSATLTPSLNINDVLSTQGGIAIDPASLQGCFGDALVAAYNKVANVYRNTVGYSPDEARAQFNHFSNAGNGAYQAAKNTARTAAAKFNSDAVKALNQIGNAFLHPGKKKHSPGPDPRMASEVFDWDYYYDAYPDLAQAAQNGVDLGQHWITNGLNEGRQANPAFSPDYYLWRYLDVQQQCPNHDRVCAINHWLNYGIAQGRQGSTGFNVVNYLNNYPSVAAPGDYQTALMDYLSTGIDAGRTGAQTPGVVPTPVAGPVDAGGGGGNAWDDGPGCNGQPLTGFNVWYGGRVDGVQFGYGNDGYNGRFQAAHGYSSSAPKANVQLAPGEVVVRVDYRNDSVMTAITFYTSLGRVFGPYGGTANNLQTYNVTPGQALGCMSGRAGSSEDHLTFTSTNWR